MHTARVRIPARGPAIPYEGNLKLPSTCKTHQKINFLGHMVTDPLFGGADPGPRVLYRYPVEHPCRSLGPRLGADQTPLPLKEAEPGGQSTPFGAQTRFRVYPTVQDVGS